MAKDKRPKYTDDQIEQMRHWRRNIPDKHHGAYRKGYDKAMNKESMRAAVNGKCLDCMGWMKTEVQKCDIVTCTLWPYRPYQSRRRVESGTVA